MSLRRVLLTYSLEHACDDPSTDGALATRFLSYRGVGKQWDHPVLPLTVRIFDHFQEAFTLRFREFVGNRVILMQQII